MIRNLIRQIALLPTVVVSLVKEDPSRFVDNVASRLGGKKIHSPRCKVRGKLHKVEQLRKNGHLSEALALASSGTARWLPPSLTAAASIEQELARLQASPSGRAPESFQRPDEINVLYFLTNSLPHTSSGYALRSQILLHAASEKAINIRAATRLGYPVVIGRLATSNPEWIGEIAYHRLLPLIYPQSLLKGDRKTVSEIVSLARRQNISVLHTTTGYQNALVVSQAALRLNIPWVYEMRGELERTWISTFPDFEQAVIEKSERYNLWREQETRCAMAADRVVVLSEISKRQLEGRGVDSSKIHVIPNSADPVLLETKVDKLLAQKDSGLDDAFWVGSITSVVEYEGLATLIRSLEYLPPDTKALIVGEGTAKMGLVHLARTLNLSDRVVFAGRRPANEAWRWYSALDVFTMPRRDTLVCRSVTPIKPLAAQALGIPVVASDLPALREVTGNTAIYVPADDPEALAVGIQKARQGECDVKGARDWARQRTWTQTGQQLQKLYHSLQK